MQTKLVWIRVPRPNKANKRYGRPTFAKAAVCRSWEKNWGSVKLPKAFGSGKVFQCHQPATSRLLLRTSSRARTTVLLPRLHVPHPDGVVPGAGDEPMTVRLECYAKNCSAGNG